MGDINQFNWVRNHSADLQGPFLEVGSKLYGGASFNYRSLLSQRGEFLGTDMSEGDNVDIVADLTTDFDEFPVQLRDRMFGTVLCLSVLEHVRDIYAFTRNLSRLVAPGGVLLVSVPWVWRFHGYPSDYWRLSPEALKFLFSSLHLNESNSCISFQQDGKYSPLMDSILATYPNYETDSEPRRWIGQKILGAYRRFAKLISPSLVRQHFNVLYPCNINGFFQLLDEKELNVPEAVDGK